ncbi:hypothetical protein D3C81_2156250 [compost metagenome]
MGNAGTHAGSFCGADFCCGNGQPSKAVARLRKCRLSSDAGSSSLLGKHCQLLLNGLERADRFTELLALTGIAGGHVQ